MKSNFIKVSILEEIDPNERVDGEIFKKTGMGIETLTHKMAQIFLKLREWVDINEKELHSIGQVWVDGEDGKIKGFLEEVRGDKRINFEVNGPQFAVQLSDYNDGKDALEIVMEDIVDLDKIDVTLQKFKNAIKKIMTEQYSPSTLKENKTMTNNKILTEDKKQKTYTARDIDDILVKLTKLAGDLQTAIAQHNPSPKYKTMCDKVYNDFLELTPFERKNAQMMAEEKAKRAGGVSKMKQEVRSVTEDVKVGKDADNAAVTKAVEVAKKMGPETDVVFETTIREMKKMWLTEEGSKDEIIITPKADGKFGVDYPNESTMGGYVSLDAALNFINRRMNSNQKELPIYLMQNGQKKLLNRNGKPIQ